jgi:hypothetical protein
LYQSTPTEDVKTDRFDLVVANLFLFYPICTLPTSKGGEESKSAVSILLDKSHESCPVEQIA